MKKNTVSVEEIPVTMTTLVETELCRTLEALHRYQAAPGLGTMQSSSAHAALHRATLDLSKMLAQWRKKPCGDRKAGQPK